MGSSPWRVVLGQQVRAARVRNAWSFRRAEDESGVPQTTWRAVEGGRQVSDDRLIQVGRALGWGPDGCFRVLADEIAKAG